MAEMLTADRLRVFISSTISECQKERESARKAIRELNFEPVQFEREGARAEFPRDFYLRKLQDSHVVLAVYRNSYGWIDDSKGMNISGLEDEFREAQRLGKDFLAYVLKSDDRAPRLEAIVKEIMDGPHVIYFFEEDEDLATRIRDDLTALVTDRVTRAQTSSPSAGTASATLRAIFRDGALRVRRNALLDELSEAAAQSRIIWVTGASGAGKTALVAEWSLEREVAYVDARGMDVRTALLAAAERLGIVSGPELAAPLFDDVRSMLLSRWRNGCGWPLILDDPDDADAVWAVLLTCLGQSGVGSVIIVTRERPDGARGESLLVPGFTSNELKALSIIARKSVPAKLGDLPILLRDRVATMPIDQRFEQLDATSREMLGYLSLAPVILTLDDMQKLLGSASRTATEITERVAALDDLLMESSAGYGFIHDSLRKQISERLMRHPQLNSLLTDRLSNLLADTGRSWAAFCLRRSEINERVARLANRAASEAVFTGSRRHLTETLEYLVVYYRSRSEKGRLVTVLLALAEVRANHGRASEAEVLLREARALTEQSADSEAEQMIDVLEALIDLRGSASATALARVRALRNKARADGQADLEGRLLLDEGVAYLGVNDTEASAPLFRRAREIFKNLDDVYGLEVATRNLIASLSITREGRAEAEALRASLDAEVSESPRYRAWLCNLDVPRLRIEKRYEEAQALAREAISIGIELGDDYLVAINQIVLGNVLRDARDFEGARTAYAKGSELGQSVGRRDIEGRSRRLLAAIDNQAAEAAIGKERLALAVRAEQNATHAADLLKESFAWIEQACALEERANALRLQDRDREAMSVYALAISGYSRGGDVTEVERLMRFFVNYISDEPDSMALIARAFDGRNDLTASSAWVEALSVTLSRCPKSVAPSVLGCMIQAFLPHHSGAFWFDCLIRSLFAVDGKWRRNQHSSIGSILLLTILGFGRHRKFNTSELLTLAGICLSGADHTIVRHRPGGDFHLVIHLGAMRRLLFTVRTEIRKPESMFVALVIGSFLDAFSNEVSEILSPDVLENGAAIDVIVFSQGGGSRTVENFFHEGLKDKPVATARINAEEGEEAPIIIIARADAIEALEAGNQRGGELEIMLARFLDEVIFATTGRSIDDEIFSKKVRDLLMSVLG